MVARAAAELAAVGVAEAVEEVVAEAEAERARAEKMAGLVADRGGLYSPGGVEAAARAAAAGAVEVTEAAALVAAAQGAEVPVAAAGTAVAKVVEVSLVP